MECNKCNLGVVNTLISEGVDTADHREIFDEVLSKDLPEVPDSPCTESSCSRFETIISFTIAAAQER